MNAMVCADANYMAGQAYAYAWDQSGAGVGKLAYGQFNRDPPTGNSPTVSLGEGQSFKVGAYWVAYGGFGEAYSSVAITVYLYYLRIGVGWEVAGSYEFKITSWQYPSQAVYYEGTVSVAIPSPPKGAGGYSVAAKAWTYTGEDGGECCGRLPLLSLFHVYRPSQDHRLGDLDETSKIRDDSGCGSRSKHHHVGFRHATAWIDNNLPSLPTITSDRQRKTIP
jgi:hypothetical protein